MGLVTYDDKSKTLILDSTSGERAHLPLGWTEAETLVLKGETGERTIALAPDEGTQMATQSLMRSFDNGSPAHRTELLTAAPDFFDYLQGPTGAPVHEGAEARTRRR